MEGITITPKVAPPSPIEDVSSQVEKQATLPVASTVAEDTIIRMEIAQYLDIKDFKDDKFDFIYTQLSKADKSKGHILSSIRSLETKIGLPRFGSGETRLSQLYTYLRAQKAVEDAIRVKDSYLL